MIKKIKEKEKAIKLRKQGLSYREILDIIPVAKSTLSLWLRSVGLSKEQRQRLTEKKLTSMKRGWESCHRKRVLITKEIKNKAEKEITKLTKKELLLVGVILYWAEGTKEKKKANGVKFTNSDPQMIKIFIQWLLNICKVVREDIYFEIYLHDNVRNREKEVQKYWMKITNYPFKYFQKTRWKKHKINTKRTNIRNNYFGILRVCVRRSTYLNRKIQGWIDGICKHSGVV